MALQFVDDRAQPIALTRDAGDLLRMARALGDEQRAQRFGVSWEIIGIERHAVRCSAFVARLQSFARLRRRRESPRRKLLRRLRGPNLHLANPRPIEHFDQCGELRGRNLG